MKVAFTLGGAVGAVSTVVKNGYFEIEITFFWKQAKRVELLILPFGIEMTFLHIAPLDEQSLLIVPYGIKLYFFKIK